jgi:hypothetical protein
MNLRTHPLFQPSGAATGAMTPTECAHETVTGQEVARVKLVFEPVTSPFLLGHTPGTASTTK